jgi:hypothetical protein
VAARPPPRSADHERGPNDRDLQGGGACPRTSWRASPWTTCRAATPWATHADGDREPGDHPALRTRSPPAWTSAWSTTGRCRTTTGCVRSCAARRHLPDRQRHRGGGGLSDLAPAGGADLREALEGLRDLDGFFTFAVGTADGFAVLRDPIACKPAVLAETDDWVAMASEYRAIAVLPGAEDANVGSPRRRRSTCGSEHWSDDDGDRAGRREHRPGQDAAARAQRPPARGGAARPMHRGAGA